MEGQGVAASAASEAGRHGEPGAGAVVAADFEDPGVSHVTSDASGGGDGQRRNGDDTLVMPAFGRPEEPQQEPQHELQQDLQQEPQLSSADQPPVADHPQASSTDQPSPSSPPEPFAEPKALTTPAATGGTTPEAITFRQKISA